MNFTAQDVKVLRERTGCGMMDCKKALSETDGDMDKAIDYLREKGLAKAAKKAGRIAAEGIVDAYVDGNVGVLIEVNSETDFVAKNDDFRNFVKDCQKQVIATNPVDVETLLNEKFVDGDATIGEMLTEKIATIGENMNIRRFARYEGIVETYIHGGGRIGVIVKFDTTAEIAAKEEFKALAHDVCMQVAAAAPAYLEPAQVPADVLEKEKEVLTQQALNEGKPEAIVEKMVVGRINKYYKEVCLVEQEFVKDPDVTVKKYVADKAKAMGGEVKIVEFARFEKGEGLEKREDDFASEVASMVK